MTTQIKSNAFSDFIRNATDEENEQVYMEVLQKATERQQAQLRFIERATKRSNYEQSLITQIWLNTL